MIQIYDPGNDKYDFNGDVILEPYSCECTMVLLGACMSGTGPTVFGLFDDPAAAEQAAGELRREFEDVFLTRPV